MTADDKILQRLGGRITLGGVAGTVIATVVVLAMIPITGSGFTPVPIAAMTLAILAIPPAGFALMAEGSARQADGVSRLAARTAAVMMATISIALLAYAYVLITR